MRISCPLLENTTQDFLNEMALKFEDYVPYKKQFKDAFCRQKHLHNRVFKKT